MAFDFHERVIDTIRGPRLALIATPNEDLVFTRERAEVVRRDPGMSDLDREIVEQVDARRGKLHVFVFRGSAPDGKGSWTIDANATPAQTADMGNVVMRSQVPVWRYFLLSGVFLNAHVGWGPREAKACQAGLRDLADELGAMAERHEMQARDDELARLTRLDLWITRNLAIFLGGDFERVFDLVLPQRLGMLAPRLPRIQKLIRALPERALDQPCPAGIP
jgi:hypothetical protein